MIRGTITYIGAARGKTQALKKIIKEGTQDLVREWHEKFFPKHFTSIGAAQYKYATRNFKYTKKKKNKRGHELPLVFTGQLKRETSRSIRVSGTSKGAKGILSGPKYMYYFNPGSSPDKAAELVAVSKKEVTLLAKKLDKQATKRLNDVKTKRTVRM